jgi:hypothetical protein
VAFSIGGDEADADESRLVQFIYLKKTPYIDPILTGSAK